jgi:alpha-1,6-mannosyltransferase
MKTLHLTNCWHSESGGISTFYRELLRYAQVAGRPIRLVVPGPADREEPHGDHGLIYYVRSRCSPFNSAYRIMTPGSYLLPGGRIRQILTRERPDVVECCDKYTLNYLAGLLRIRALGIQHYRPTVVGLSCERMDDNMAGYVSTSSLARTFCRWYMQRLYFPLCDHHIAVSPHTAEELRTVSFGHRKRRGVWVLPMGADCELFTPERRSTRTRHWLERVSGAPEGSTLMLYAGRLAPEKNVGLLLDTMRLLEELRSCQFHLLIAGDGPLRCVLERACERKLPGSVYFLGHIRNREVLADLYANCDLFVHPNAREPFGIAPLEAMASGLPVIGPSSGGITCYANAENASLVDPDPESFAAAAIELRESPAIAEVRRRAGRETAKRFNWPAVAASFFRLYEELHAIVQGQSTEPITAPEFYSSYRTVRRDFEWQL